MNSVVQSWLGVPFRYRGYDKTGCDCAGLVLGVLQELGVDVGHMLHLYLDHKVKWSEYIDGAKIMACLDNDFTRCAVSDVGVGDIAVLSGNSRRIVHLGIVSRINPMYILHAHRSVGCVVETIVDELLLNRLLCVYCSGVHVNSFRGL